jgi:hypothetical protein
VIDNIHISRAPGIAAAVNQALPPLDPTSHTAFDGFRSAGIATRMVKKVSELIEICHFLILKIFLTSHLTASLLLPTRQQLYPPASLSIVAIN